jgi:hypothetical protein
MPLLRLSLIGLPTPSTTSTIPSPSLSATAGHGKPLLAQTPGNKRGQHFFDIAADAGDDLNPTVGQACFQRLRDAGTNQRSNVKFRQLLRSLVCRAFFDKPFLSGNLSAIGQCDQQQLPRNVEDRRYTAVPDWNGEFHGRANEQLLRQRSRPFKIPFATYVRIETYGMASRFRNAASYCTMQCRNALLDCNMQDYGNGG